MNMQSKLISGDFLVLAEMEPPKGVDVSHMVESAVMVRGRVDAFVVPEMSNAVMRMSSLGGAILLQSKGFEAVMQLCCRDRNRLALQADLLAAEALGVANVMAVTGEDPSYGDHHKARAVYDIDLLELLHVIKTLQQGRDMAGVELRGAPSFLVGSFVNSGATGGALDLELQELDKKMAAGAEFFLTPPVFDLEAYASFSKKVGDRKGKIIPTVLLLKSVGMARYIDRHLDNVSIPAAIINRIQKAGDRVRECVLIAAEIVRSLKEAGCCGVHIVTIGWENKLLDILDAARL
ncbi:MAG: methylenetetrahydrofolate reductase [Deltaproteobacteria bacterium]|nr:methylenetetrahydrofolate reductase [Deltaproteobacteria bacterium]MBW2070565.1 methylenetetrahydrofolate reductase [Deltaproteobacteria bacterium]